MPAAEWYANCFADERHPDTADDDQTGFRFKHLGRKQRPPVFVIPVDQLVEALVLEAHPVAVLPVRAAPLPFRLLTGVHDDGTEQKEVCLWGHRPQCLQLSRRVEVPDGHGQIIVTDIDSEHIDKGLEQVMLTIRIIQPIHQARFLGQDGPPDAGWQLPERLRTVVDFERLAELPRDGHGGNEVRITLMLKHQSIRIDDLRMIEAGNVLAAGWTVTVIDQASDMNRDYLVRTLSETNRKRPAPESLSQILGGFVPLLWTHRALLYVSRALRWEET